MLMVGLTNVYSVGELRTLGYVALSLPELVEGLESFKVYWVQEQSQEYAVSFHDFAACQTRLDSLKEEDLKRSALAIGITFRDLPDSIQEDIVRQLGLRI